MNKKITHALLLTCLVVTTISTATPIFAKDHPNLILSKKGVSEIKKELGKIPLFDKTINQVKAEIDAIIDSSINVPLPVDAGGGYTHERHKKNYNELHKAGVLYQVYGDAKYAIFVKKMLNAYAKIYPTLPLHPVQKSKYRGKLFWQGLNECVWLVHVSQAYDCIYTFLTEKERKYIEDNLFAPMVKFISEDNASTFNKIHNHGTWAVAGVGMIGYVTNNKEWVERALHGSKKDGKGGFMKQLDLLFSPDGYFTEGPYYQRYSLHPFIVFAQAIENNDPSLKIFEYRDRILKKAVNTSLQLAYTDGQFFHLNDALDKTWHSIELVYGVDIIYNATKDNTLLPIAIEQDQVILGDAGLATAKAVTSNKTEKFKQNSILIRDGANGDEGGIGILRMGDMDDQTALILKATAQGMGHGHFDKLSISLYDNGREILQDYGAARFLNIEQKNGGHYLPENDTWAKQTIAHNTLVVDETSNFKGELEVAEKYSPKITNFVNKEDFKLVSAVDTDAYPGVKMERTVVMVQPKSFSKPIIVDLYNVTTENIHQYDLSFYYSGQVITTDLDYVAYTANRQPMGKSNGYEFLWKEAESKSSTKNAYLTFLNNNRFYTITTTSDSDNKYFFNRLGANDPNFNLRQEPSFMIRKEDKSSTYFLSIIEPHGLFNPREEFTIQSRSNIKNTSLSEDKKIVSILTENNKTIKIDLQTGSIIQ